LIQGDLVLEMVAVTIRRSASTDNAQNKETFFITKNVLCIFRAWSTGQNIGQSWPVLASITGHD